METNKLVQRGELDNVLSALVEKQKAIISDIDVCLPLITEAGLIDKLKIQRQRAKAQLKALEAGYVPIVGGWFWDIDTKSKWGKKAVKEVTDTMPEEVKQVVAEIKESGVFEKVKVSGSRRGDPMLVGTAGKQNFLIAMWANLEGGYSIGMITNRRKRINGT